MPAPGPERGFKPCPCFAIPPKMFRRLVADPKVRADEHHHRHSGQLRSLRYQVPPAPAPAPGPGRSRKPRRSVYDLNGGEALPGRLVRSEKGKPATDVAANEAFENTGIALAFFREQFGRNSIDGKGLDIVSAIHYGDSFPNAMWNGTQMIYGDGDEEVGGFTAALDIIAHELCHGLTQYLIPGGLGVVRVPVAHREFKEQRYALQGEGGALNESFSDVFGSLVKQWHAGQKAHEASWLIGENVLARRLGRAVRSLKSPGNRRVTWPQDDQMHSMEQYYDACEVHDASGIANRAFYLAACGIGGYAWEKTGRIWFEAYDSLKRTAGFAQAARATVLVAESGFGAASAERKAVEAAWQKVKVLP